MAAARITYLAATPDVYSVMIFTDQDKWLDQTTGLLENFDAASFNNGNYFAPMSLYRTLSGVGSWYIYQLPQTVELARLNVAITNVDGVVAQDHFCVGYLGEEVMAELPLGENAIPIGDMLDTSLATVAGTCNGAGTGIESFQGVLGQQRVRSHIDTAGNRTSVDYGP